MSKKLKPPLSVEAQVELLKDRGLIIEDDACAIEVLSKVNYYRLSAYSLGLRHNDVFHEGTTFNQIHQIYQFDAKIRHLLLAAIESIEIKFRTKIAHYLAMEHGVMSHLDEKLFFKADYHRELIEEFETEKERQKDAAFVKHHNEVYGGNMPIWAAIELFSFGMLSKLYRNLKIDYQRNFVRTYLHKNKYYNDYLVSWFRCLVEIRNICAHYGRIYNRILTSKPKIYPQYESLSNRRIFPMLIVIINLIDDHTESTTFITNIAALIAEYPVINLEFIGFPPNWEEILKKSR